MFDHGDKDNIYAHSPERYLFGEFVELVQKHQNVTVLTVGNV